MAEMTSDALFSREQAVASETLEIHGQSVALVYEAVDHLLRARPVLLHHRDHSTQLVEWKTEEELRRRSGLLASTFNITLVHLARMIQAAWSALQLCIQGHYMPAQILNRLLIEEELLLSWLLADPDRIKAWWRNPRTRKPWKMRQDLGRSEKDGLDDAVSKYTHGSVWGAAETYYEPETGTVQEDIPVEPRYNGPFFARTMGVLLFVLSQVFATLNSLESTRVLSEEWFEEARQVGSRLFQEAGQLFPLADTRQRPDEEA